MKLFSNKWKASKSPRKQRKYRFNVPLHKIRKLISVQLDKDLKIKYGKRNIPIRKGDRVKVMVGEFKGKLTKVRRVDYQNKKVYLDDVFKLKRDGSKLFRAVNPSNLKIVELILDDKLRKKLLERK